MSTRQNNLTPEMMAYYNVRYDKLIEELRQVASILDRPNPIPTKQQRIWLMQHTRSITVDVIGAK